MTMSDADEAWREWDSQYHGVHSNPQKLMEDAFLAGFAAGQVAALEDAANTLPCCEADWWYRDWLAARATELRGTDD